MYNKISKIVLSLFVVLLIGSCKKYPDGPFFSLLTVKHRVSGIYQLDKFIVNGIDSTAYLPPCIVIQDVPRLEKNGNYYFEFNSKDLSIKGLDGNGGFIFSPGKKNINIGYVIGSLNPPSHYRNILSPYPNNTDDGTWEIRRLTNSEFWIRNTANTIEYDVHLKKIKKI